jgi:hypothetical protein
MTGQERDYEELLSRVLHSTTDQIEPVGDGLTKIRTRLTEPWLKRQWWLLRSEFMVLGWLVAVRCESFLSMIRSRSRSAAAGAAGEPGAAGTGPEPATGAGTADHPGWLRWLPPVLSAITAWVSSHGPGRGPADGPRRSPGPVMNWLRPALAVAGAVVLVVAGVFALGQLRQTIVGVSAGGSGGPGPAVSSHTGAGTTNSAHGGRVRGSKEYPTPRGGASARRGTTTHSGTSPTPSPCATPSTSPGGQSPTPTPSSSSPTPTTSPTATTSPTPTVSPTATSSSASLSILGALDDQIADGTSTAALTCAPVATANPSPSNLAGPA